VAAWSTVPRTDWGRALQSAASAVFGWFRLAQALGTATAGAMIAGAAGYALLQDDRALPRLVRQFVNLWAGGYSAAIAALLASGAIRPLALTLLLIGLLLCGWSAISLCNWFLDRKGK
jgi:hypothetical protein